MNGSTAAPAGQPHPFLGIPRVVSAHQDRGRLDARVGRSIGGVADARYERVDLTLLYLINYSAR